MVKTRKRLVSLVLAVVMIATLLIPMVGPASANVAYSMTNIKKIYNTGEYVNTYQKIGQLEFTFDAASWNLASKAYSATNTNFIYLMLPTSPAGYAFGANASGLNIPAGVGAGQQGFTINPAFDTTFASGAILSNVSGVTGTVSGTIYGGQGTITMVGMHPVSIYSPNDGYQVLAIYLTNVIPAATDATSVVVSIQLPLLSAPTGTSGSVTCNVSTGGSSSVFSGGASSVVIATVGAGTVSLATESTPSITSNSGPQSLGIIDIKENSQGVLYSPGSTTPVLSLTLPPGFEWSTPAKWEGSQTSGATPFTTQVTGGAFADMSTADSLGTITGTSGSTPNWESYDVLTADYAATGNSYGWTTSNNSSELDLYNPYYASAGGQWIQFTGSIIVSDPTQAQSGPINVTVTGLSSSTVSNLNVGNFTGGTYSATTTNVGSTATIVAGKAAAAVGEFELQESSPGSLVWGRTITLTLPTGVAWAQAPNLDNNNSTNTGNIGSALNSWTAVGSTGTEIQCSLTAPAGFTNTAGPTSNLSLPGNFYLMDAEVTTAVDFTGPVTATIGGSEGLTGTVTLANVSDGVTAAVASTPAVQIGSASQSLGDITITEAASRSLDSTVVESGLNAKDFAYHTTVSGQNAEIDVIAPAGVTFATTPTVSVTSGNIELGTATTTSGASIDGTNYAGDQGVLQIPIDAASSSASTIKIAAPVVTIDNTVPQGPITFKIEGTAVNETMLGSLSTSTYSPLFPNDTAAASLTVANVGTVAGAANQVAGTVVLTIGQSSYTVNGTVYNIDVAPYIKDSRTFLPLRAVANALGVADSNIMWDSATHKVTIIEGGTVLQLTIGSTMMLLNGAQITMDTAPEITNGRTCLPVAWVAKALGANIQWDATSQTVTITAE